MADAPRKAAARPAPADGAPIVDEEFVFSEDKKGSVRLDPDDATSPITSLYVKRSVTIDPARRYRLTLTPVD